jgi:Protein of unknown function (DUF4238)
MPANVHHHFVPQFYLRNFAIDRRERRIAMFHLSKGLYVPSTSIRGQAQRAKLYGSQQREKALGDVESAASPIIRIAVKKRSLPTPYSQAHADLLIHVLTQAFRTPRARDEMNRFTSEMLKKMASYDPKVAPHLDSVRITVSDPIGEALRPAIMGLPLAMDLCCKLLVNRTDMPFLTSDNPVVLYNQMQEQIRHPLSGVGIASAGLEIFLPLSPDVCLVLYDFATYRVGGRSKTGIQVQASREDVEALNGLQIASAEDQIFTNGAMSESTLRNAAHVYRKWHQTRWKEIETTLPRPEGEGRESVLIITTTPHLQVGLRLSPVSILPSARARFATNAAVHLRNPPLCAAHDEFCKQVDRGKLQAGGFGAFLRSWHGESTVVPTALRFFEGTSESVLQARQGK